MSGSFKGVFVHGVLDAFEAEGLYADVYASASSSTLPTAYAAIRCIRTLDTSIWTDGVRLLRRPGSSMSEVVLETIRLHSAAVCAALFGPGAARFLVAAS